MIEREHIEQQIRDALASSVHAFALNDRLFGPAGLFALLGPTEESRREVAQSPLFREALRRLGELERQEISEFGRVARQAQSALSEGDCRVKLERA